MISVGTQSELTIDTLDAADWAGSAGVTVALDTVEKMEGVGSLKVTVPANTTSTVTKALALDLTRFSDGSAATNDDFIHVWVRVDLPDRVVQMSLAFDAAGGDFATKTFTHPISTLELLGPEQWTELWVSKGTFLLGGGAHDGSAGTGDDWATIRAARLTMETTAAGPVIVHLDDLRLAGGAGPDGTYTYKYTYVNTISNHESNPSPASNEVVAKRQPIVLPTIPAAPDPQVDAVRWYRRGGAIADYEEVAQVALNTSYSDTFKDIDLGKILETDNDPPPPLRVIWEHLNLCMGITTDCAEIIAWSKRWKPESFPLANTLVVTHKGEPLQVGVSWNGIAYVWSDQRLFRVLASDVTDPATGATVQVFAASMVEGAPGTLDARSVQVTPAGIIYRAFDGLYRFDGVAAHRFSDNSDPLFHGRSVGPYSPASNAPADLPTARAVCHRGEYWISYPTALNAPNAETQVWDLSRNRLRAIYPFGMDALWDEWSQDVLVFLSDQTVYLLELDQEDDAGASIAVDLETSFQAMDGGMAKPVQALVVDADAGGATLTVTVPVNGGVRELPATASVSAIFGPGRTRRFFKVYGTAQEAAIRLQGSVTGLTLYRMALSDNVVQAKRWMDRE